MKYRFTHRQLAIAIVVVASAAVLVAGASGGTRSPSPMQSNGKGGTFVALAATGLGKVLVDPHGRTLYLFLKDRNGRSMCVGSCAQYWPPLLSSGKPRAHGGVRASLLGVVRRPDGRRQVTYASHPLYTFALDMKPGQTNGEGLTDFGAPWYVVATSGKAIRSAPTTGGTPPGYGPR
jgi:predicted lipoprotein with Yx(FWY)xxD motif